MMKTILILLSLVVTLAGCKSPQSLTYDPTNWDQVDGEAQVWRTVQDGVEIHAFRQIVPDASKASFRVNYELFNQSGGEVTLFEAAKMRSNDQEISGQVIHLFSPEGMTLNEGEYAEIAAVFDLAQAADSALSQSVSVTIVLLNSQGTEVPFDLTLARVSVD